MGMTLALLLAQRKIPSLLYEEKTELPEGSMAIGLTPPSLALMDSLGLREDLVGQGTRVERVQVYESKRLCGSLDFACNGAKDGFVLSLPQNRTVQRLREAVNATPEITLRTGCRVVRVLMDETDESSALECSTDSGLERVPVMSLAVGADGHRSRVRETAGISARQTHYGVRFFMADVEDRTGFGAEARLYFDAEHSLESFPLSPGWRRWVVGWGREPVDEPEALLLQTVRQAADVDLADCAMPWTSRFTPSRMLASTFQQGRIFLCGDAAHVMSPIGGQGMNTGLADAGDLAQRIPRILSGDLTPNEAGREYRAARIQPFRSSACRAALGMWLGTRRGQVASAIRGRLIRYLLRPPFHDSLARTFSMTNLPGGRAR